MNNIQQQDAQLISSSKAEFSEFISEYYGPIVKDIIENDAMRLIVDIDIMRKSNAKLAERFLIKPMLYYIEFQKTVQSFIHAEAQRMKAREMEEMDGDDYDPDALDSLTKRRAYRTSRNNQPQPYFLGFSGSFGSYHVTPRGLRAAFISHLICVDGIVTKCSLVRPKVVKSVHFCEVTKQTLERSYSDATTDDNIPTTASYPTKDKQGNPLLTEFGYCEYKDSQCITIQEMPECAPAGQLPRSIDILVDNDLVDQVKPGDRVQVVGIYRAIPITPPGTRQAPRFRTVVIGNSIRKLSREAEGPDVGSNDIQNIRRLASEPGIFDLLASSMAPSIFGHEYIKKALLLLMLGGVEKNLPNGTHLRGDINILMVGDPSTAKSQLLRFVLNTAPLAINTTGRGSSGVGLTAAVTNDSETGERRLEAGAMVLADRGIVCIDEFDKMSTDDRVAIHEVMEQQTVTISKAGIHASLNARCSVVAAANPIYGQYNRYKKPHDNICLPDSLLSRFDLLFIVLDHANPDHDRHISDHILRMHRYKKQGEDESYQQTEPSSILGGELDVKEQVEKDTDTPVYQKYDKLLHGGQAEREILSIPFIQKYIRFAKNLIKPSLSDEAKEYIVSSYTELRSKEEEKTLPITTRTLETLIRLSSAHAKCRLSPIIEKLDSEVAYEILQHALFSEANSLPKPRHHEQQHQQHEQQQQQDDDVVDTAAATTSTTPPTSTSTSKSRTRAAAVNANDKNLGTKRKGNDRNNNNNNNMDQDDEDDDTTMDSDKENEDIVQTKKKQRKDIIPDNKSIKRSDVMPSKTAAVDIVKKLGQATVDKFGSELSRLLVSLRGKTSVEVIKKKLSAYDKGDNIDHLLQHQFTLKRIFIHNGIVRNMQ
ncbi:hypothetical protein SAMD00019534_075230 [Acytostelium subglobosum LB1]|uniref:hypothetical protein n=1 Tax=Acytostelium subglobosum LB1 TaxID=1410327 RepID=UPI000644B56E|nr:hypothetical protein SAMD00019534_075230 [Acytostelium subglobosum LB1]GAM24348.1 hypothetical protein SAMD00019534_075230 [Acytostelium subglobosum LB1]|eukprot:XP_012752674.1 hypothetical protein SAMD00019534_075230 [Acytostelium subglobosum LB1]